ncbi:MAG: hypothetical protein CSB55_06125 [Candidatus Cloacimonadota bacterium]|nr:MAG: hypothetical protein CSB55_06125 [Candidatus Cloacimonadota bacterium]
MLNSFKAVLLKKSDKSTYWNIIGALIVAVTIIGFYLPDLNTAEPFSRNTELWDADNFAGIPAYDKISSFPLIFLSDLKHIFPNENTANLFFLMSGAIGFFFYILRSLKNKTAAFTVALAFGISGFSELLFKTGWGSSLTGLSFIPWALFFIRDIKKNLSLISYAGLILVLSAVFSEADLISAFAVTVFIFAEIIVSFMNDLKAKQLLNRLRYSFTLIFVFLISLLASSYPLLPHLEISSFTLMISKIGLADMSEFFSGSLHWMSFIFPHFTGGKSLVYQEIYSFGNLSVYFGIVLFIIAVPGISGSKKHLKKLIYAVVVLNLTAYVFLSFFTEILSEQILQTLKSGVSAVFQIILSFTAALGIIELRKLASEKPEKIKLFMFMTLAFTGVIILSAGILYFKKDIFSFDKFPEKTYYSAQQLQYFETIKIKSFIKDTIKISVILGVLAFSFYLLSRKKIKSGYFEFIFLLCLIFDFSPLFDFKSESKLPNEKISDTFLSLKYNAQEDFAERKDWFRIYPMGQEFNKPCWSKGIKSLGSDQKRILTDYNEITEKSLHKKIDGKHVLNWNLINMLGVKYLIFNRKIEAKGLVFENFDEEKNLTVYKNKNFLPHAVFVEKIIWEEDKNKHIKYINSFDFNPEKTAITVQENDSVFYKKDFSVVETFTGKNHFKWDLENSLKGYLVISEPYYEKGWKAYLNGKEVIPERVNYMFNGLPIPPGKHSLELKFEPKIYELSRKLSLIGYLISILSVLLFSILHYRINYQGKRIYIIK